MKIDRALLKRFKNNECSEEETRSVYEWLSDPGSSEEVAEYWRRCGMKRIVRNLLCR